MNPIFKLLIDAVLKYAQAHPDEIEKLIGVLVNQAIAAFHKKAQQP